jgi:Ca2+-binding RTX toxin-like protein
MLFGGVQAAGRPPIRRWRSAGRTARRAVKAALGAALCAAAMDGGSETARAVEPNGADLEFILEQIRRAEAHAGGGRLLGTGPNQISSPLLPYGLRTVNGKFNNLIPGQEEFGMADRIFPRLVAPLFRQGEPGDIDGPGPAPPSDQDYDATSGFVFDSQPRTISNLIVDQSPANPAAANAAGDGAENDRGSLVIPNVAPDVGLSAPFNSWFTLFGQFFDHGLDLTTKGGGTVVVPLKPDDPLIVGPDGVPGGGDDPANPPPPNQRFMVLTRAKKQPGGLHEHTNTTTPFVDQNQTYTSHPAHQVFLREYELRGGAPVATGRLLDGADGEGLANWDDVKRQAREVLGIELDDFDVLDLPLVLTDPYGRFSPAGNGMPQLVTSAGTPPATTPGSISDPVDASDAVRTGHAFLDDIAHHANPLNPSTGARLTADDDDPGTTDDDHNAATYDDEMLGKHFVTGDGRGNENIGLTAVHHVFHAEHNLRVEEIKALILQPGAPEPADWQVSPGVWSGERLFQAARFVTEMEYQHLVFEEFARKVQPQVNLFAGYHSEIDPAIVAEFAHTVYRFGHSMLRETVARTSAAGPANDRDIGLIEAFLNPLAYDDNGDLTSRQAAGQIVRGMTRQRGNEIDEFVTGALRNNLVGLPLDLATINMARGRDTGVPSLNAARRTFFAETSNSALRPYDSWRDFQLGIRHPDSLVNFVAAYGTHDSVTSADTLNAKRAAADLIVNGGTDAPADRSDFLRGTGDWADRETGLNDVDFWVGGLAEKQMPFGGLLGSTFNFVFETQMEKLQDGDRLYYLTRTAGLNFLTQLEENSFAELVMRTTDTTHLPFDIFSRPDFTFEIARLGDGPGVTDDPSTDYNEADLLERMPDGTLRFSGEEHVVLGGTNAANRIHSSEGDGTLWGDGGNDRLEGGAGNDAINGGDGDDVLTDLFGDDNIKGGPGDDAINAGGGFDLILAGNGGDFVVAGADPKETFAGAGNDFVIAGDSADTVFANEGDDWIEGGAQADLLQGDNGDPFQEGRTGDDVIIGDGGDDDYDSEGGDDVMVTGPGIERNEGMIGFDWVTHRGDPQAANADMRFTGLLPPDLDNIRDRFDNVEGLSGWDKSDVLRGDDTDAAALQGDHELTRPELVSGLQQLIGGATRFTGGNIVIGGDGSDLIEGRGGNDLIDGDAWLNVRISVRSQTNPNEEIESVDSMKALQARVFSGDIKPSQLRVVRRIETPAAGAHVDTAVFTEPRANYDITPLSTTEMTITHARGSLVDGTDTLKHIERLQFADQTVAVGDLGNLPATGTVTISDTTPAEDQLLTATRAFNDPEGVNESTIQFAWQTEEGQGGWTTVAVGSTFRPGDGEVGAPLRVVATFNDNDGVIESVTSAPTAAVANVNDPASGTPTLNDTTPQAGVTVTALTGAISDNDGLAGVPFAFRWEQENGSAWSPIGGATSASFTPGAPQVGHRLRVVVSFTDVNGTAESVTSAPSAAVVAAGDGPAPGGGPGQGLALARAVTPVAPVPALGVLLSGGPGGSGAAGGVAGAPAPTRVSGLAVSRSGSGPLTVAANVPAGANVVRIRVFRLGRTASGRAAAKQRGGRLVATVYRPAPKAKRYRFRLTEPKLRRLQPGRYRIEVRAGRSRAVLGPAVNRSVSVRTATGAPGAVR